MNDIMAMFGGLLGIFFIIFLLILLLSWVFIPFVLIEIKNVLYKILYELENKK